MKKVKISKLKAGENPEYPTSDKNNFKYGEDNEGFSLPIDYYVTGTLLYDLKVGKPAHILRENRNGVEALGVFQTSIINTIEKVDNGLIFYTLNSIYRLEWL
jgi:hypothetical protein